MRRKKRIKRLLQKSGTTLIKTMWRIILPRNLVYFLKSFFYFCFLKKNDCNVLFFTPQHFNRDNRKNPFIEPLIQNSIKNNITHSIIEEPTYEISQKRRNVIHFDFISFLVFFMRKVCTGSFIEKEQKIGSLLAPLFFRNKVENIVVQSQSMISFFRGAYPLANIYDYQHGVIYDKHPAYFKSSLPSDIIAKNHVKILVFGKGFKKILDNESRYYKYNTFNLGINTSLQKKQAGKIKDILVTLQFTEDHSLEENNLLLKDLTDFIIEKSNNQIILKHHPRFNNEVDLSSLLRLENVSLTNKSIYDCLSECKLHATAYSTAVFEAASIGVPTVFYSDWKIDIYKKQFAYPIAAFKDVMSDFKQFEEKVKDWHQEYYEPLNEKEWLKLMA